MQNPSTTTKGREFEEAVAYAAKYWLPARSLVAEAIRARKDVDPSGQIIKLPQVGGVGGRGNGYRPKRLRPRPLALSNVRSPPPLPPPPPPSIHPQRAASPGSRTCTTSSPN
jgi:hypothetical protein